MKINTPITSKKALILLITGLLVTVLPTCFINIKGIFFDNQFGYDILFDYQSKKLSEKKKYDTLFLGDSSLGNLINADLVSRQSGLKCVNLALTGMYGYAGTYNMLKKFYHPGIKNVVIIQASNMLNRPLSYKGYLMTIKGYEDFDELTFSNKKELVGSLFNMTFSLKNFGLIVRNKLGYGYKHEIQNDYLMQSSAVGTMATPQAIIFEFNKEKLEFLKKIMTFCEKREINLVYMPGPIWKEVHGISSDYFVKSKEVFNELDLQYINHDILIENEHLGDTENHIHAAFKDHYTLEYLDLMKFYLKGPLDQ